VPVTTPDVPSTLVVFADDNPDALESMTLLLESYGYAVATASNGRQALDLARSLNPQIILLDLWMPVMDGFEAAELLRRDPRFKLVFIGAISGSDDQATMRRVAASGFDAHFLKPVHLEHFFSALRQAVRGTQH
jgi:CheY-like chemotaxis protein